MSDNPYERVKGGRLTFKGGALASSSKSIDKKRRKKKNKDKNNESDDKQQQQQQEEEEEADVLDEQHLPITLTESGDPVYTIDAAKKMKYEDLFPVEAKKFGYDPKVKSKSVQEALDDRVKKKADRYCK